MPHEVFVVPPESGLLKEEHFPLVATNFFRAVPQALYLVYDKKGAHDISLNPQHPYVFQIEYAQQVLEGRMP